MAITLKAEISDEQIKIVQELATLDPKKHPRGEIYLSDKDPKMGDMRYLADLGIVDITISHMDGDTYMMAIRMTHPGYKVFDYIEGELKKMEDESIPKKIDYYHMTYNGWIEAFTIFSKYGSRAMIGLDHDVVYAGGGDPSSYSEEDKKRLEELHWGYNERLDSYYKYV